MHPFNGKPNCAVIGVFDGHGPCGEKVRWLLPGRGVGVLTQCHLQVSQFVRDKLPEVGSLLYRRVVVPHE